MDNERHPAPRVVLDTNVLVGGAYAPASASRRLLDACLAGELLAVGSPALLKEYHYILPRAVRIPAYQETLRRFLDALQIIEPGHTPRVVADDPDDDKLVAVALAAGADALVSNDRHLLSLDPHGPLRILRPVECVRLWLAEC